MIKLLKLFFASIWKFVVENQLNFILVPLYMFVIRDYKTNRRALFLWGSQKKITLLALKYTLFRGDLDVLSEQDGFRLLYMPLHWQSRLFEVFYPENITGKLYYNAKDDPELSKVQKASRSFMHSFLRSLYKKVQVDAVVLANIRYLPDLDWAFVSKKLGKAYIFMFREGLIMCQHRYSRIKNRHYDYGKFHGSHILVHNEVSRKMFLESGFATEDQISVCGVLRMDNFLKKLKSYQPVKKKIKKVVYFYITHHDSPIKESNNSIYKEITKTFILMARSNPGIQFIVKPKIKHHQLEMPKHFYPIFSELGIDHRDLTNLTVEPNANAQDLIFSADVVCGLNSTTLLEAAVAGKKVIIPFYKNLQHSDNSKYFVYKKYMDLFDVADNSEHFTRLVVEGIEAAPICEKIMKKRQDVFDTFVSRVDASATCRYIEVIRQVIKSQ